MAFWSAPMTDTDNTQSDYQEWFSERLGRKMKIEYLGMASVYAIIGLLFFNNLPAWYQSLYATIGAFFLFLGLKKKTEDHLSGSLILFAAAVIARDGVYHGGWAVPYLLFGVSVFAMEGYLEKRPVRIYAVPVICLLWALAEPSWWLGFIFMAVYMSQPRPERPGLRRRFSLIILIAFLAGLTGSLIRDHTVVAASWPLLEGRLKLGLQSWILLLVMGIPALLCLFGYWERLVWPHRLNTLIFACLAPWDARFLAMFGMVAAVLLSGTVFRNSVDSEKLRAFFKHAEWLYFWIVFAIALSELIVIRHHHM
jgi:hypothetical protein